MGIKIPQQSGAELAEGRISKPRPSSKKSSLFQKLAFGAGLATVLGFGAAACGTNRGETETEPEPDAAGEVREVADDAGTGTREDGEREDAGREDGGYESRDDAGAPVPLPPEEPDFDRDGVPDDKDRCLAGDDNDDIDLDGIPRACDPCPNTPPAGGARSHADNDFDGVGAECDLDDNFFDPYPQDDDDLDRIPDGRDNACGVPNHEQVDADHDGVGAVIDCDDSDSGANVHPANACMYVDAATDTPGDGIDSDCDGVGQQVGSTNADGTVVIAGEPDYTCIPGITRNDPDGSNVGECEMGTQRCVRVEGGSEFGSVEGGRGPSPEVCNSLDDDCDGSNDEEINCDCVPGDTQECGEDEGVCEPGEQTCRPDRTWSECEGGTGPEGATETLCDRRDENCDGDTDENFGVGQSCRSVGDCGAGGTGVRECASASTTRCSTDPGGSDDQSRAEVCDGTDNDCDGEVDEGSYSVVGGGSGTAAVGTACDLPGLCGPGTNRCADIAAVECSSVDDRVQSPGPSESPALCNGEDDDCDGAVDEGCDCPNGTTRPCGESAGACSEGTQTCTDGAWEDCVGGVEPTTELCNRIDEDCDGSVDNGFGLGNPCLGRGECGVGVIECATPTETRCSVNPGGTSDQSTEERCNGLDDDCDARVDEDFNIGARCSLPGVCGNGVNRCRDEFNAECSSEDRRGTEIDDDGLDNDCDGDVDE